MLTAATVVGDYMVLFGGLPQGTSNNTMAPYCYSDTLVALHLTCGVWTHLSTATALNGVSPPRPRPGRARD